MLMMMMMMMMLMMIMDSLKRKDDEPCIDVVGCFLATLIGEVIMPITSPMLSAIRVTDNKGAPFSLMWLNKLDGTLGDILSRGKYGSSDEIYSLITQLTLQIGCIQFVAGMTHSDLLPRNVMFKNVPKDTFLTYEYRGEFYEIPTYGKVFYLIDFGWSSFTLRSKSGKTTYFKSRTIDMENYDEQRHSIDLTGIVFGIVEYALYDDENSFVFDEKGGKCTTFFQKIPDFNKTVKNLISCLKEFKDKKGKTNICVDGRIKGEHNGAADSRYPYNPTYSPGNFISMGILEPFKSKYEPEYNEPVYPVLFLAEPLTVIARAGNMKNTFSSEDYDDDDDDDDDDEDVEEEENEKYDEFVKIMEEKEKEKREQELKRKKVTKRKRINTRSKRNRLPF